MRLLKFIIILLLFNNSINLCSAYIIPVKTVGVTQIVSHPALNKTCEGVIATLKANGINVLHEDAQGNVTTAIQIAQKFIGAGVDAIVTISTPSTQAAISAVKGTRIPVFFASVTDPQGADLVKNLQQPEGQVTGCSNFTEIEPQLELFKTIIPDLKNLGILYNSGEVNSVAMISKILKAAQSFDINVITVPITCSNEIPAATRFLLEQVDALFISNDNTVLSAFDSIVKVATDCHKPVFVSDTDLVDQGAIAALGPNQRQVGEIAASMVIDYFSKQPNFSEQPIPMLAVRYPTELQRVVNPAQAQLLNIKLP